MSDQQPDKLDKILDKVHEIAVILGVFGQRVTVLEEKVIHIEKKVDDATKFSWTVRVGAAMAAVIAGGAFAFLVWVLELSISVAMKLNSN